ncbi:MAG TPA: hypothetical protein VET24_05855 [Actinomycetota bacterium]|nr:hypothetical protein [Actinomycetota bacterium]
MDDVPRSSTCTILIPATSALSERQASRWVRRQLCSRRFWWRPQSLVVMPLGSPTTTVATLRSTSQATTDLAASWWAWRTLRRWRASALRRDARWRRQRRLPLWPFEGALPAAFWERRLVSSRCRRSSERTARPDTRRPSSPVTTAKGWMMPRSMPAITMGSRSPAATATSAVTSR